MRPKPTRWLERAVAAIRLPTEAEWEKAASAAAEGRISRGSEFDGTRLELLDANCEYDWKDETYDDGYTYTAPVGSYPEGASPYGALDMAGNVWEWVNDWYQEDYYSVSPGSNPQGRCRANAVRGGSWFVNVDVVRSAYRGYDNPVDWDGYVGFRCAAALDPGLLGSGLLAFWKGEARRRGRSPSFCTGEAGRIF
jgi:formylglycine-generating enzyme required for sulfatase activity